MLYSTLILMFAIGFQSFGLTDRFGSFFENIERFELKQAEIEFDGESGRHKVDVAADSLNGIATSQVSSFFCELEFCVIARHDHAFRQLRGPPMAADLLL